jgi:C4-dicarboxylate-specific signal transduction histidine kinase
VLDNLIKNALEAMVASEQSAKVLTITTSAVDDETRVAISDNGHGISEEQLKNMFRFGFTTKVSGNGFGLHSAALAMGEMGGNIRVTSRGLGCGAEFTITLPTAATSLPSPNKPEPAIAIA